MTSHTLLVATAALLAVLSIWLGVAYRRYAATPFTTDRRRRVARSVFLLGAATAVVAYGWLAASVVVDLPKGAGLTPLTVGVSLALIAVVPLLVGTFLAIPLTSWE